MKFLLILAWLVIDGNTLIFHKQESPVCFLLSSNGSDNTFRGLWGGRGREQGSASTFLSELLFEQCCCPFLPQLAAAAGVGDAHPENCLMVLWQPVQGKGWSSQKWMEKTITTVLPCTNYFFTSGLHPSAINGSIPDKGILKGKRCKHFALACQRQA